MGIARAASRALWRVVVFILVSVVISCVIAYDKNVVRKKVFAVGKLTTTKAPF